MFTNKSPFGPFPVTPPPKMHKCDKGPYQVQSVRIVQKKELTYIWWEMQLGDCKADITFCPFCGEKLPDDEENENYAKKSAALVLSAHLHISEQGTEAIVDMLIEAVKHELQQKRRCDICPNDDDTCYCYDDKPARSAIESTE